MNVALGMIIRSLDSDAELMNFIENAEKYGHKLDCVIVAYTHRLDARAAERIRKKVPFFAVNINAPHYCMDELRRRGVSDSAAKALLSCPVDTSRGLVPYGFNRTVVLTEAVLRGVDTLFFVDSDVLPSVLKKTPDGLILEEMDFFGAHFELLNEGSKITTAEYSGYNILPPASFEGMEDLLHGLQKGDMLEYWRSSEVHRSLTTQPPDRRATPCTKVLGGNVAMKLSVFSDLPPFFSTYYTAGGELFLGRGEDTVLGAGIKKSGVPCTDTGLYPMHDTYKDYPAEPDLRGDPAVQERFYYACTGWVGRNPLLNYIHGNDPQSVRESQREHLERGLSALVGYTSNERFYGVLNNFDISWGSLGRYINDYERIMDAWEEFIKRSDSA